MNGTIFTTKYKSVDVFNLDECISIVIYSNKTHKTLEKHRIFIDDEGHKKCKSYTALVRYARANSKTFDEISQHNKNLATSTSCPAPAVPSDDGGGASFQCSTNQLADAPQSSAPKQEQPTADACTHPLTVPAKSTQGGVLFLDTETTGLGRHDEVIEISIVDEQENIVFNSLLRPTIRITDKITDITGITHQMLSDAPSFLDIFPQLDKIMSCHKFVLYNADFDKRMILQTANRYFRSLGYRQERIFERLFTKPPNTQCLMLAYAQKWGDWSQYHQDYKWQRLKSACTQQGIDTDDITAHRATGDAIMTARLYKHKHRWRCSSGHQWLTNVRRSS